jgi:membrane-bound lytic murein transglycosylase D
MQLKKFVLCLGIYSAIASHAHASQESELALEIMLMNNMPIRSNSNTWERLRSGFQISEVNPSLIRQHEQSFIKNPGLLKRSIERSQRYMYFILDEVERRGLPTELALLPIIESSFQPEGTSHVGAAGLWQFMPATGKEYGLEQTFWYDGRRDVIESTRAALDYLNELNTRFDNWHLALASYNWGMGKVDRALRNINTIGVEHFEAINLPKETRNYVPRLLAVRNIIAHPERFGITLPNIPNQPYFVAVNTGKHIDVQLAAQLAGISEQEFRALNPGHRTPVYAHKQGRQMLIPLEQAELFEYNLSRYQEQRLMSWQIYQAGENDSLEDIAARHQMSIEDLIKINRLTDRTVRSGQPFLVTLPQSAQNNKNSTEVNTL